MKLVNSLPVDAGGEFCFKRERVPGHRHRALGVRHLLATGNVPGYSTLDLPLNVGLLKSAFTVKAGAINLLNAYYCSFTGGPVMGGFYYTSLTRGF